MEAIAPYRSLFEGHMRQRITACEPDGLYAPIAYIMGLGGKRLRPILTLIAAEAYGKRVEEALEAALAVEVFHNFSLVHDDIMDAAPLRRGQATVHHKWDVNTGILSGDAMLIMAYRFFEGYPDAVFSPLVRAFGKMALEVCEGQQYDMDFESRDDVTLAEYLRMIEYKTAVLLGTAVQLGAIVAGASWEDQEHLYTYGRDLGLAFQLQDDYLDAFGDPKTFGKQVGGDIQANKKTYLYLKALELADTATHTELVERYSVPQENPEEKVARIKDLFIKTGAVGEVREEMDRYTREALAALGETSMPKAYKQRFTDLGEWLMGRSV